MVVLNVSIGIKKMRNRAAPAEAALVLAHTGRSLVESLAFMRASTPVLAAVSPFL